MVIIDQSIMRSKIILLYLFPILGSKSAVFVDIHPVQALTDIKDFIPSK